MCTILLKNIIDSKPQLQDAGDDFYVRINDCLDMNENVVVDMSDVTSLPSIFLNVSIGRVIDDRGVDVLKRSISFVKITKQQAERLKEYLNRYNSVN